MFLFNILQVAPPQARLIQQFAVPSIKTNNVIPIIHMMWHNQQHNSQKPKNMCKQRPVYTLLNIRNNPPLHAFCGQWVLVVSAVRDSSTSTTSSCVWDRGRATCDSCVFLSRGMGMWDQTADEVLRCSVFYSSFCCSFFWKQTGKMESTASTPSTAREFQDTASPAVVSLYSVVPALIATKDGGATPVNERSWTQVSQRNHLITKHITNIKYNKMHLYQEKYQWRKPPKAHWWQVRWCWWTSWEERGLSSGRWCNWLNGLYVCQPASKKSWEECFNHFI